MKKCPLTKEAMDFETCASFLTGVGGKGCRKMKECYKDHKIDWEFVLKND